MEDGQLKLWELTKWTYPYGDGWIAYNDDLGITVWCDEIKCERFHYRLQSKEGIAMAVLKRDRHIIPEVPEGFVLRSPDTNGGKTEPIPNYT